MVTLILSYRVPALRTKIQTFLANFTFWFQVQDNKVPSVLKTRMADNEDNKKNTFPDFSKFNGFLAHTRTMSSSISKNNLYIMNKNIIYYPNFHVGWINHLQNDKKIMFF